MPLFLDQRFLYDNEAMIYIKKRRAYHSLGQSAPLRTRAHIIARTLHIGTYNDLSIFCKKSTAHAEMGIGTYHDEKAKK